MEYLEVKNLEKSFKDVKVFKDINFKVQKGEFLTLLGPSGCGKSTLLRCISGLTKVNNGKIFLNNKNITKLSPQKRNMGMVFQHYALFPNLSVFENVAFGLKVKKESKKDIEKRVNQMLDFVELSDFKKKYPTNLSGGQKQRVALARSLVTKPDLLLLDEPLSALDAKIRKNLREQIKKIQKKLNLTTIFVTHDQEEALLLSDNIILMEKGKIAQNSDAQSLYLTPKNKFVASFIGSYNILTPEMLGKIITHNLKKEVAIRPETIEVSSNLENVDARGKILDRQLLGNIIRYEVQVSNIILKVDTLNFSINSYFEIGNEVGVKVNLNLIKELN